MRFFGGISFSEGGSWMLHPPSARAIARREASDLFTQKSKPWGVPACRELSFQNVPLMTRVPLFRIGGANPVSKSSE